MSFKQVILGICVTAAALVATVRTVAAAGPEAGLAARPTPGLLGVASPAATVGAAAVGTATAGAMFATQATPSFDSTSADAAMPEEALPASSLAMLALAALLSVGLLMTRRNGRA